MLKRPILNETGSTPRLLRDVRSVSSLALRRSLDMNGRVSAELCRKHEPCSSSTRSRRPRQDRKLWAHEHYGLRPDIITVSKALSGGYIPVGAMMCSAEIFDRVYSKMGAPSSTPRHSGGTSLQWWRRWPPCRRSTTRTSSISASDRRGLHEGPGPARGEVRGLPRGTRERLSSALSSASRALFG